MAVKFKKIDEQGMVNPQTLYVAVDKNSGKITAGQNKQYAFGDKTRLKQSVNYRHRYKTGLNNPRELYDIFEVKLDFKNKIAKMEVITE